MMSAMNTVLNRSNAHAAALNVPNMPTVEDVSVPQVLPKVMVKSEPIPDLAVEEVAVSQLVPSVVGARMIIGLPDEETTVAKILAMEEDPDDSPKLEETNTERCEGGCHAS